jgi:hypothetical protein
MEKEGSGIISTCGKTLYHCQLSQSVNMQQNISRVEDPALWTPIEALTHPNTISVWFILMELQVNASRSENNMRYSNPVVLRKI